ncbi:glutamine synthetase-like N-terminal domain protein [Candidatus Hepatincolaceae symbiont of Richtersius coronifer]
MKNLADDLSQIEKLVIDEEIISIDIRYANQLGFWEGKVFSAKNFNYSQLKEQISINEWLLAPLELKRNFIDPFLAHKTLVLLTDIKKNYSKLINTEARDNKLKNYILPNNGSYGLNFYIKAANKDTEFKTIESKDIKFKDVNFAMPPLDEGRDIRTEIVLAATQMGVPVISHNHGDEVNKHYIEIKRDNILDLDRDNIQKVKYSVIMAAKAYNLSIDIDKGMFVIGYF